MNNLDLDQINHIDTIANCIHDEKIGVVSCDSLESCEEVRDLNLTDQDLNYYLDLLETEFEILKRLNSSSGQHYVSISINLKKFIENGGVKELAKKQLANKSSELEFDRIQREISELTLWKLKLEKRRSWTYYFSRIGAVIGTILAILKVLEILQIDSIL